MRRRKFTKILISILCIIALILPSSAEVLAALSHTRTTAQIGISKMHPGGPESTGTLPADYKEYYDETAYAYKIKDINIFKIKEVGDNTFSDALYCLDATKEFPLEEGLSYNNVADLYDSNSAAVRALGLSEENYKSLIWLIENIYIKSPVVNQKDELLGKAFEEKIAYDEENGVIPPTTVNLVKTFLTDDDIDVIQQWAIWYYTNNNIDTYKTLGSVNISVDGEKFNDYLSTLGDAGALRREYAQILYNYLVTSAGEAQKITYPKIETTSGNLQAVVEGDYYKVGPFKLASGNISKESYELKLVDANDNEISKSLYQIKIEGETEFTNKSVDEIFDVNYYIYIPNTEKSITDVKLSLKYSMFSTKATLWTHESSSIYQPLVLITKEVENKSEHVSTIIDLIECDLALRKYIVKIDDTEITTRVPVVDTIGLRTDTATTAEYKHPKNPLPVKVGQKVVYEITAYNEHSSEATVTQIKDYLPEGLRYVANSESEINSKYGWVISADGRTATTAYTADYKLAPFDKENNEMSSVTVQIECIVDESNNVGDILTNGAEITADDIEDRDSNPKSIDPSIIDDEYTGNDSNKEDLSDSDYHYKGQEDDDDFEKVIIVRDEEYDLSLRKYIVKIDNTEITTRVPVVDTTLLRNETSTTAEYKHPKDPLPVKVGQKVVYEITAYNEQISEATVTQIKDYLPEGLKYVDNSESEINSKYGWVISADGRTATTAYTADYKLAPFDKENNEMSSVTVQIECIVDESNNVGDILTNGAEITADDIEDRDSNPKSIDPSIIDDEYIGNEENKEDLSDSDYYYKGQEDDDDFEKIIIIKDTEFDLALRKFITHVNNQEISPSREPVVDLSKLISGETTTAIYTHPKNKVEVKPGDKIIYTLRVYNEGTIDGIAEEVTDYLPTGLVLVEDSEINSKYGWRLLSEENSQIVVSEYLKETTIPAFNGSFLAYVDLQIECEVVAKLNEEDQYFKNIAEITKDNDEDRDSEPDSVVPEEYPEQGNIQDDDDYEEVFIDGKSFDLALRKFITKINGIQPSASREPVVDVTELVEETSTTAEYRHPKYSLTVEQGDIVVYTLRIYNEGDIDGYAEEITDYIPEGLGFLVNHKVNVDNYWSIPTTSESVKLSTIEGGKEKLNVSDFVDVAKLDDVEVIPGRIEVTSSKLKYNENEDSNLIKAFNKEEENATLSYKDVQIACIVLSNTVEYTEFKNIAEVSKDLDNNGEEINDRDSIPDTVIPAEYPKAGNIQDDDDYEKLSTESKYFDLSLRKFITGVNEEEITSRIPVVSKNADGDLIFTHTKEPVLVANGDLVTYTLRIYNEGEVAGYASEITDNIPTGLVFVPENETNTKYEWKMYDEEGKETTDVTKASTIKTDYLSKEKSEARNEDNLIKIYDRDLNLSTKEGSLNPDYRDIKVVFKITETKIPADRILINTAEISDDSDEDGNPVDDIDSIPGNDKDGEDDIDNEYVKVKYFDLSLLKWVSQVVVIEDGVETVTDTGHSPYEVPEPIVKVDINRKKIKTTVVKFVYTIRITNEGEIPGYATEITDYVPEGLEFYAEDNPIWLEESNGIITTSGLAKKVLNPGESIDVQITLRWINDSENLGTKVNVAEISEDYNVYGAEDIDSVPDNQVPNEDDIDDAPVLLTITTGTAPTYIVLALIILTMFAVGLVIIKKYILN